MEVGLDRSPAQALHGIAVPQPTFGVVDWDCPASDLDLAFVPIRSIDDAVHENAVVGQQVSRFPRLPHHRKPEVAFEQERFDRAQPRRAISPHGREQEGRRGRGAGHVLVPPAVGHQSPGRPIAQVHDCSARRYHVDRDRASRSSSTGGRAGPACRRRYLHEVRRVRHVPGRPRQPARRHAREPPLPTATVVPIGALAHYQEDHP